MQIELIGCTGAGKSTLSQQLVKMHRQNGLPLVTSYDFVLRWAHFDWVKPHKARMFILNIAALLACLLTWRKNLPFFRFVFRAIARLPKQVSLREKLKIARIALRNVGIFEIASRGSGNQIILADEGTLHIASYLFVHASLEPNLSELRDFLRLVALPDVAVYVQQPSAVLIDRTRERGHKRIPRGAPALVERFIRHSLTMFEHLTTDPTLADRLVVLNSGDVTTPAYDPPENPRLAFARRIFELNTQI